MRAGVRWRGARPRVATKQRLTARQGKRIARSMVCRRARFWLHRPIEILILVGAATAGCANGCGNSQKLTNSNASAPAGSPIIVLHAPQSETTLVAATVEGYPAHRRLIMGYNDDTDIFSNPALGEHRLGSSNAGWATSDDNGRTWTRRDQLPTPAGVAAIYGDPWMAARGGTVLYAFMGGADVPHPDQIRFFALLSVSNDGGSTFAPAIKVSGAEPIFVDGPKVAISRDGSKASSRGSGSSTSPSADRASTDSSHSTRS